MITTDILPRFQRNARAVSPGMMIFGCSRCKEKHLLLVIVVAFILICFGTIFFMPDFSESLWKMSSIGQVQKHVQDIGEGLLMPPPPMRDNGDVLRHDGNQIEDPHVVQDREKLFVKVKAAGNLPPPLEKPYQKSDGRNTEFVAAGLQGERGGQFDSTLHPVITGGEDADPVMQFRRRKIKEMMQHAWRGYASYAWGANELRPVSKRGHSAGVFGRRPMGATIVDALDTLFIMGLKDEFAEGRLWIKQQLDVSQLDSEISVFEMNIRYVGGLLSCFALTGDALFRDKALQTARALLPAFNTPTGVPFGLVVPTTGRAKNYGWASRGSSILSEFGTLHMEFSYLSDVTGQPVFRDKVQRIRRVVNELEKPSGLYPNYLSPTTGKWGLHHISVGALGDSFYEYLLKEWLRTGGEDREALQMYRLAIGNITDRLVKTSTQSRLTYVSEMRLERPSPKMDHLACFVGGLYALGAARDKNGNAERHMEIGKEITRTCHESYDRTITKLGPESFRFTDAVEARAVKMQEKYYILRPEVIESYFVLWRLTGDRKYRDWGWEAAQAIEQFCRVEAGFSGIQDVESPSPRHDDVQQSFFLAETLKYLYLLFSDNNLLSLDQWVFNTEAHPLPIKGVNQLYRQLS